MSISVFGVVDYVVFLLVLLISLGIGVYYTYSEKGAKSTTHFLMGDDKMRLFPVSISILVSLVSAIAILGLPAEIYMRGTMFFYLAFAIVFGSLLSSCTFVPLIYPLRLTNCYEYLGLRFDSWAAEVIGSVVSIIQQVLYIGVASYTPSTALQIVTHIPEWATIIMISMIATTYTAMGGMKAVIWTDFLQSGVMLAGMLAILIQSFLKVGGITRVLKENYRWNRIQFDEMSPDPRVRNTVWSLLFGGTFQWFARYGIIQASVQRYSLLNSMKKAKQSLYINTVGVFVITIIACTCGIAIFAYYSIKDCDPFTSGKVSNPNQIVVYFVMEVLNYPGLPGLLVASLFSGALSTVSSSLNGLAAITWETFLKNRLKHLSDARKEKVTKFLVGIFGILGMAIAFLCQKLKGPVTQIAISFDGLAGGPLLGIFLLGAIFPQANSKGCIGGGVISIALLLWMCIGKLFLPRPVSRMQYPNCSDANISSIIETNVKTFGNISNVIEPDPNLLENERGLPTGLEGFYAVSYLWYPVIGSISAVVIGMFISWITGFTDPEDVDDKYLFPIAKYFRRSHVYPIKVDNAMDLNSTIDKVSDPIKLEHLGFISGEESSHKNHRGH